MECWIIDYQNDCHVINNHKLKQLTDYQNRWQLFLNPLIRWPLQYILIQGQNQTRGNQLVKSFTLDLQISPCHYSNVSFNCIYVIAKHELCIRSKKQRKVIFIPEVLKGKQNKKKEKEKEGNTTTVVFDHYSESVLSNHIALWKITVIQSSLSRWTRCNISTRAQTDCKQACG